MNSVYIHIPFCNTICSYCDFCKVLYNKKYINDYLDKLELEIKQRYNNEIISTIYIGGGTPTSLDILELKKLLNIIKIFKVEKDVEVTIETNIENIDREKLELLYQYNINRLSIGVQSFNKKILHKLNRKHNNKDIFNKIKLIKDIGFTNISIDLIYAVNNNFNILKKDIKNFIKLDIPHISCYSLQIENNTILGINNEEYIDDKIDYKMYKYIDKILKKHHYNHYEISNYAKDNYLSKHNLNYWNNGNYYGFGLSSVSFINNKRITNTKNLSKYLRGNYHLSEVYEIENIRQENDMILGLRKINGVNNLDFYKKYNKYIEDVFDIDTLIKENKLIKENNNIKINEKYLYLSNDILLTFIKGEDND